MITIPYKKTRGSTISVPFYWRENSWIDSNETIRSSNEEDSQPRPKARCGCIIPVEFDKVQESRDFWKNCLVGVIIDVRRFSVRTIQRIINNAWRVRDIVTVVERANNNYILHFNDLRDQVFIWQHGPGQLMVL